MTNGTCKQPVQSGIVHLPEPPTMLSTILLTVVVLFPASEVVLARVKRASPQISRLEDRGSLRLMWLAITIGVTLAVAASWFTSARLPGSPWLLRSLALSLMVAGLALRWVAIFALGRFFTVDVAIQADQSVVESGPYRFVRHPSYSGLLLAFVGLGLFFQNWLSILVLIVPIALAVIDRVAKEEQALLASLGRPYAAYSARTKRFIPYLL
jgi:protein-S-isoprenylcysteine O-methyltransferase Ste14